MLTSVRAEHDANNDDGIAVILPGKVTLVKDVQPENIEAPKVASPSVNVTVLRSVQFWNTVLP